jgi:predicted PurR-regulated permease PerM
MRSTALSAWFESNAAALSQQPVDSSLIVQIVSTALGSTVNLLTTTVLTLLIFFFMLAAAVSLSGRSASGEFTDHPALARITGLTENVRRYLVITTVVNLLVGAADMVFLLILGVDFALLWGIASWLLGYIPAIGFWLALIPPAVLAWAESGPLTALWVVLGYWLINGSVENLLKPRMLGQGLRISPVVVFVSLFVWGWLLGAIGALLAIPLTLLILIILESFESTRWLVVLLQPADQEEAEKGEARRRLRQTWERAKGVVSGDNSSADI